MDKFFPLPRNYGFEVTSPLEFLIIDSGASIYYSSFLKSLLLRKYNIEPSMSLSCQYETDPASHTAANQNIVRRAQTLQDSGGVLHPVGELHSLQAAIGVTNTGGIVPADMRVIGASGPGLIIKLPQKSEVVLETKLSQKRSLVPIFPRLEAGNIENCLAGITTGGNLFVGKTLVILQLQIFYLDPGCWTFDLTRPGFY